jgi:hypothetical protein
MNVSKPTMDRGATLFWLMALAMASSILEGCHPSDVVPVPPAPLIALTPAVATQYLTGGAIFPVIATATAGAAPIVGLTVTFAGAPSTVTVTPATAMTDAKGEATSYAFVPYAFEGTIIASGGGVASNPMAVSLSNDPIQLTKPSLCVPDAGSFQVPSDSGTGTTGTIYDVCTTAQIAAGGTGADAGGLGSVPGIPVTFSVLFPSGSDAPLVTPMATTTDSRGVAMATIAVPPGVGSVVIVASTGTSTVETTIP